MIGHRRAASISVTVLHVRTSLPNQRKTQCLQNPAHFTWFENGRTRHLQKLRGDPDALRPHKLAFQLRFTVLQQHLNDFPQIHL